MDTSTYGELASNQSLENAVRKLTERGIEAIVVSGKAEALKKIQELIPSGASVNNGASRTLEEIGFVDYLKSGKHAWNNLHEAVVAEKDPAKQAELRRKAIFADYYLGSVHALSENGEMVIASATGSQLAPIVFTSPNLIFVAGIQKIAPNLDEAIARLRKYVFPLEDKRMKEVGMGGSTLSKILVFEKEPAFMGRKVKIILVKEKLGF